jgi:thioredoxin 2
MAELRADEKGVRVSCPACGQANRIPFARLADEGKCGKCGQGLPVPAAPVEVPGEAEYAALIAESVLPVLVDYWAPWCGPCRMVAPEMEKVAATWAGRLVVAKANTEDLPGVAQRERIMSIPTMAVFREGRRVASMSGAMPARDIEAFLRAEAGLV